MGAMNRMKERNGISLASQVGDWPQPTLLAGQPEAAKVVDQWPIYYHQSLCFVLDILMEATGVMKP
jgi:hypothetical protein